MFDAGDLFAEYAPLIRRYLVSRADPDEVDDLLSETFERVVRTLATYEDRGYAITSWLYSIARCKAIDLIRSNALRPTWPLEEWSATVDGPEDLVARALTHEWIRDQILTQLSGAQQQVIWLRFVADLSQAETARRLGLPVSQVKVLQWRGVAKLRMAIAPDSAPPMMAALATAQDEIPRCAIAGCGRPRYMKTLCITHYTRERNSAKKSRKKDQ